MDSDAVGLKLLDIAKTQLGYAAHSSGYTKYGDWFASHVEGGDSYYTTAPWCDMFLAWAADQAGVQASTGEFAATPDHAKWFQHEGAFGHTPEIGAVVFFAWNGGTSLDDIEHVGLVESVHGSTLHTIEANTSGGQLMRKTRDTSQVVGYGYPSKVKVAAAPAAQTAANTGAIAAPYLARHAAPPPTADAFLRETATTTVTGAHVGGTPAPSPHHTSAGHLTGEVAALSGLVGLLLCGSLALAVGKATAAKVPTPSVPEVRVRKRGRHHRSAPPVVLPADVTAADFELAEAGTVVMPILTLAAAQRAEDEVFWGKIADFKDDDELAFWSDLHDTVAQNAMGTRDPAPAPAPAPADAPRRGRHRSMSLNG